MADATTTARRATFDFLEQSHGKRVVVETAVPHPPLQTERYGGVLEEVYDDSLLIRPDNGRLVLIYKHAIVSVTEA